MPPLWADYLSVATAVPEKCEPTNAFLDTIASFLHICIPTPLALVSSTLGALSIVSWLFAQLPQIYKNYVLQSTAGLSPFFLVEWCLGDSTNLLGAIFTRQAGWQIAIASYYVFVDIVLVFQYYWYTFYKTWDKIKDYAGIDSDGDENGGVLDGISPFGGDGQESPTDPALSSESKDEVTQKGLSADSILGNSRSFSNEKLGSPSRTIRASGGNSSTASLAVSPKAVLFVSMLCAVLANAASPQPPNPPPHSHLLWSPEDTWKEIAGRISSWSSTILYLGSRLPQLYKNYVRKSTSGLSPLLFAAAFCGNLFYSSSLLTNPNAWHDFPSNGGGGWADDQGNDRFEWIGRAIPFFLGAFGVLGLDGLMGIQFIIYGEGEKNQEDVLQVEEGSDRRRATWRRVSGWMRGWIPSASVEKKSDPEESQALLRNEHDNYGSV